MTNSASTEEIETGPQTPKFKTSDTVKITKYNNFLLKVTPKIGQEK